MGFFLSKLLPVFVYPLGAAIVLALVALILSIANFRRVSRVLLGATVLGLWIASTPAFSDWLALRLEMQHPPRLSVDFAPVDAIVLLGGIISQPLPPRVSADLGEPADRLLLALRLYRIGKAPHIVITGGNLPWQTAVKPESELLADLLVELGVPRSALTLDRESRNTYENAQNTARIFAEEGWKSGILVTSGMHMPRALATFRKAGLNLAPGCS